MERSKSVNRRQALGLLAGGGAGAAALKMLPDPLEAAQVSAARSGGEIRAENSWNGSRSALLRWLAL
jgi:hypothetical protein